MKKTRDKTIKVLRRHVVDVQEATGDEELKKNQEFQFAGDKIYITTYSEWEKEEKTYDEVCNNLGFIPDVRFVHITNSGTIAGTLCLQPSDQRAAAQLRLFLREKSTRHAQGGFFDFCATFCLWHIRTPQKHKR